MFTFGGATRLHDNLSQGEDIFGEESFIRNYTVKEPRVVRSDVAMINIVVLIGWL